MKYYCYNEYDPDSPLADDTGGYVVTMCEKQILKEYWDYWYGRMCEKYGKEHVDANYSVDDCIEDWCVGHWAWEKK